MSGIGKHNVRTYLEACGKYQKYENSCEIEELTKLMEGYAQLYQNNKKKANGVDKSAEPALHKHVVSNNVVAVCTGDRKMFSCVEDGIKTGCNGCGFMKLVQTDC